jgi:hypothetical protein
MLRNGYSYISRGTPLENRLAVPLKKKKRKRKLSAELPYEPAIALQEIYHPTIKTYIHVSTFI